MPPFATLIPAAHANTAVQALGTMAQALASTMLAAALALACVIAVAAGAGTQLTPSVLLLGAFDLAPNSGGGGSRCTAMVDRALTFGASRLNFVPTHYYREDSNGINRFCYMDLNYTRCIDFDEEGIDMFKAGIAHCLAHAAGAGIRSVAVTPHIDSASAGKTWTIKAWRNGIVFSPLKKYGGFSYSDIMLNPLAEALGTALPPSVDIYFALQGEMGATVFRYPSEYEALTSAMKKRVELFRSRQAKATAAAAALLAAAGAPEQSEAMPPARTARHTRVRDPLRVQANSRDEESGLPGLEDELMRMNGEGVRQDNDTWSGVNLGRGPNGKIKMGATFNFIFIDGNQAPDNDSSERYREMFRIPIPLGGLLWSRFIAPFLGMRSSGSRDAPPFSKPAVQSLFKALDFVGISAYSPLKVDFSTNQLQNSAFNWMQEASAATGLDMAKVMKENGIELQYAEYGLGGGSGDSGDTPAASPGSVAAQPYWGVTGPYSVSKDPWSDTQVRHFMRSFYSRTLEWLSQGGGPTYPVSACYLWNLASWDVLAIYPESTTTQGSYEDQVVASMVTQHNNALRQDK